MALLEGFIGGAYEAPSLTQDAQELINWYPEVDPMKKPGERGVVALLPTPGLTLLAALPAADEVRALYTLPGGTQMLAVCANQVYLVNSDFSFSNVGSLSSSSGQVSIADNDISAMIVDGQNRYSYKIGSRVFSAIDSSDGAFVGGTKVDFVDGFLVYNDPKSTLWGSTTNLSTASPALSFASKFSSSDDLVTLIADHREVFLVGERTTEVWVNTGSFPFPFEIIPGTSMQHGCAAPFSISRLGETTAWLGADSRGRNVVIQMNGYTPHRISTHAVENDISAPVNGVVPKVSDAIGFTYQQNGHEFYMLTFPSQDKTWCYDLATQMWHKRQWTDTSNIAHRHRANCCAVFQGMTIVGDWQNGNLYSLDLVNYTDNFVPILRLRRSPHLTEDLQYVVYNRLQIQFQPGVGLNSGQGSNPKCMLRWSDDGGSTWSAYYFLNIGKLGKFKNRAIKRKLGRARDRVFEVSVTDPIFAAIVSADLVASPGGN